MPLTVLKENVIYQNVIYLKEFLNHKNSFESYTLYLQVDLQPVHVTEALEADATFIRRIVASMDLHMPPQISPLVEPPRAHGALVGFLSRVDPLVHLQLVAVHVRAIAVLAFVSLVLRVTVDR